MNLSRNSGRHSAELDIFLRDGFGPPAPDFFWTLHWDGKGTANCTGRCSRVLFWGWNWHLQGSHSQLTEFGNLILWNLNGGFLKYGYPWIIYFNGMFPNKNPPLLTWGTPMMSCPQLQVVHQRCTTFSRLKVQPGVSIPCRDFSNSGCELKNVIVDETWHQQTCRNPKTTSTQLRSY